MKKIKYGNKRYEPDNRQIQDLKQGDEICGAMLDTFSDDYLSYITHLIKNTKTPNKNVPQKQINFPSSDQQSPTKFDKQLEINTHQPFLHPQTKPRRHSQSSAKGSTYQENREHEFSKYSKGKNQSTKVSPSSRIKQIQKNQQIGAKMKKRKVQYIYNQPTLKNQQKTMHFSRNNMQHSKYNDQRIEFDKDIHRKSRLTNKSREKYFTAQNQEETDRESPSIQLPFRRQIKNKKPNEQNFIDNINHYISSLQLNESLSRHHSRKDEQEERQKIIKNFNRNKKSKCDQDEYDIYELFKQNLKLNKKVKNYEEKITDLDEQISNHINGWKSKQKAYKSKIQHLLKGLVQAFMKIDVLEGEVNTLKDLHRSYGQKVKQIQTKYDDDDALEEIREQLFKSLAPKKHSSQLRTKHKKTLESTLPKYEQDRRAW